jgi:hypothetical protein
VVKLLIDAVVKPTPELHVNAWFRIDAVSDPSIGMINVFV